MPEEVQMSISGQNPAAHAQKLLAAYIDNEAVESVTVQITTRNQDNTDEREKQGEAHHPRTESLLDWEDEDDQRQRKEIQPDTSHHRVLHTLAIISDGEAVPAREVKKQVTGVSESSIYPALTKLWERKLVSRERVTDVDNPYYKYQLTEWGKKMLNALGTPSEN